MSSSEPIQPHPTAARILRHASELFRSHGYDAVSVARITRESGVAKGTFFLHFPTKEHVLLELFDQVMEAAAAELTARDRRGTDAIVELFDHLAVEFLKRDVEVGRAIAPRFPSARLHDWVEARLGESLPIALPLDELPIPDLARLLVAGLADALVYGVERGVKPDAARLNLGRRTVFLLRSAGLAASPRKD